MLDTSIPTPWRDPGPRPRPSRRDGDGREGSSCPGRRWWHGTATAIALAGLMAGVACDRPSAHERQEQLGKLSAYQQTARKTRPAVNPEPLRPEAPAPGLTNTFASVDDLARAFLEGLERDNFDALRDLGLSSEEFAWYVWPELPSSIPDRNLSRDYVWGDMNGKSLRSLRWTLAEWGGEEFELVRVEFAGEATTYHTFTVFRDARLVVRDEAGREGRLDLFGSVMERDGRYKLFSFVTD